MSDHSVRITFPNKEQKKRFLSHMCDGGGEQEYFESEMDFDPTDRIVALEYTQGPDGDVIIAKTSADLD